MTATIPNGPFQGLQGLITPYVINVTARANGGVFGGAAEVRMRREVQTVAVPVFQFGVYSENDLSFFAGPDFDFGGRVHSNQNIYLAQDGAATLTLRDVVTAVGRGRPHAPRQRAVDLHERPPRLRHAGDHGRQHPGVPAPQLRQPGRQLRRRHARKAA